MTVQQRKGAGEKFCTLKGNQQRAPFSRGWAIGTL